MYGSRFIYINEKDTMVIIVAVFIIFQKCCIVQAVHRQKAWLTIQKWFVRNWWNTKIIGGKARQNFGCIYCWYSSLPYFEGQIFLKVILCYLILSKCTCYCNWVNLASRFWLTSFIFLFFCLPNGRFLCNM